jgi:hypothetical protein
MLMSVPMSPKIQEILDQISRDRTGLLSSAEGLTIEQTEFRPEPEAWSIADLLHHLALTDEAASKLVFLMLTRAGEESFPSDPDPDGSVLDSIATVVGKAENQKAKAPERVRPRSHVPVADAVARLRASRATVVATAEALSAFDLTQMIHPHPFFGPLNAYQWLLVTGWHERRHTRQIERVKASPGFPGSSSSR